MVFAWPWLAGGAAAALLAGAAAAWQVQSWRWEAADARRLQTEQRDRLRRMERMDGASVAHEQRRVELRREAQIITREVERVVEVPLYRGECLDAAGLQLIDRALGAASDPGQPAPAMPAASAPG
jgi:hypothetical protein